MAQNWFKHDYNAKGDEKILELRAEYGWKGYGLFFAMIETMCEQETGCIDLERIGGLSIAYGLPKDELITFIEYCIEIELFFEDEDGLIKNNRVIDHLEHMNTLKEAGKKGANKRWKQQKYRGANRGANATPNADKIREDKIREDKRDGIPSKSDLIDYFKDRDDMIESDIPLEAENFINHYEDRNWKNSSGKKITEWKRQAATWNNNYKKFNSKRLQEKTETMSYHQEL